MHEIRLGWTKLCVRAPFFDTVFAAPIRKFRKLRRDYMARRPHRSFRRTLRRDYRRSLRLPGYWAFSWQVTATIYRWKQPFIRLALIYMVLSGVLVGVGSQDTFNQFVDLFKSTNVFDGGWGSVGQASILFVSTVTGSISDPSPSGGQSMLGFLLILMLWLTVVWLLRAFLAGKSPKLRDGLYNAGAPIVALVVVTLFGLVQVIPMALGIFASTSLISVSGVLAMLLWLLVSALVALSLYWLTSTFFAMIIVTLPGMYPWRAIRTAGDLVMGRRVRILLRLLWAALGTLVVWAVIMIPLILLDIWLGSTWAWLRVIPVIPIAILVLTTSSLLWLSAYVYLLYRRVVDDDTAPA